MNYLPQRAAPYRAATRPAAKRRNQNHSAVRALGVAALALTAGFMFRTPATQANVIKFHPVEKVPVASPVYIVDDSVEKPVEAAELSTPLVLASVPLDYDTQTTIWEMCGQNKLLFCTVMAIAQKETRFDTDVIGDNGNSIGMMQINTKWQADRIEALGVTDLTDYRQNVAVALDYIAWIAERLFPEAPELTYGSNALFMAYNSGYAGSQNLRAQGICETEYSAECCDYFQHFMEELEAET